MVTKTLKAAFPNSFKHQVKKWFPNAIKGRVRSRRTNDILNSQVPRRVVISAMRRSGHHAVTNWLLNAFEGSTMVLDQVRAITTSPSGKTVFINDLQANDYYEKHIDLTDNERTIRQAHTIVMSNEDADISRFNSWKFAIREPDLKIYIYRSTLNLIASRLSHPGNLMHVDRNFLFALPFK